MPGVSLLLCREVVVGVVILAITCAEHQQSNEESTSQRPSHNGQIGGRGALMVRGVM